jgi:HPt (histidine-containing phosphotransfer) domain-containing protein
MPAEGDARSVLDMRVIEDLRDLGGEDEPGLVLEIIGLFLRDAPERVGEIEAGLAAGDLRRVEYAAHALKSASANVGARGLSDLCRRIEESARRQRAEELPDLVRQSSQVWPSVQSALQSIRS